jgi:hypothetical protein
MGWDGLSRARDLRGSGHKSIYQATPDRPELLNVPVWGCGISCEAALAQLIVNAMDVLPRANPGRWGFYPRCLSSNRIASER